jgi:hypothetical protein
MIVGAAACAVAALSAFTLVTLIKDQGNAPR